MSKIHGKNNESYFLTLCSGLETVVYDPSDCLVFPG